MNLLHLGFAAAARFLCIYHFRNILLLRNSYLIHGNVRCFLASDLWEFIGFDIGNQETKILVMTDFVFLLVSTQTICLYITVYLVTNKHGPWIRINRFDPLRASQYLWLEVSGIGVTLLFWDDNRWWFVTRLTVGLCNSISVFRWMLMMQKKWVSDSKYRIMKHYKQQAVFWTSTCSYEVYRNLCVHGYKLNQHCTNLPTYHAVFWRISIVAHFSGLVSITRFGNS